MNEIDKQLLKVEEILKAPDKSRDEQYQALSELITEIMMEEGIEETPVEKERHWPGMYNDLPYWIDTSYGGLMEVMHDNTNALEFKNIYRYHNNCSATKAEAQFVRQHMEVKLAVIDRLAELNGDWRTGEKPTHFEPRLNSEGEINIVIYRFAQGLPDWFHARYEEYWNTILGEFGEEKVKLALWPKYEE